MTRRRRDRDELVGWQRKVYEFRRERARVKAEENLGKRPKRRSRPVEALAPATACDGKVPHSCRENAEAEAERLTAVLGAHYEAYACLGCGAWHTGRTRGQPRDL